MDSRYVQHRIESLLLIGTILSNIKLFLCNLHPRRLYSRACNFTGFFLGHCSQWYGGLLKSFINSFCPAEGCRHRQIDCNYYVCAIPARIVFVYHRISMDGTGRSQRSKRPKFRLLIVLLFETYTFDRSEFVLLRKRKIRVKFLFVNRYCFGWEKTQSSHMNDDALALNQWKF